MSRSFHHYQLRTARENRRGVTFDDLIALEPGNTEGVRHCPHRGKTVTKPLALSLLELPLSEKQIPQVVEKHESREKPKEALERAAVRVKQAL